MTRAIRNRQAITRALNRLRTPAAQQRLGHALFAAGERIAVAAQLSITQGAVSGKNHIPSSPGSAPNNDSGVLVGNIEVVQVSPELVEVSSNAPYSSALEFGTSKMAARPFMRPARDKEAKAARQLVERELSRIIREGN